jgi:hypothetical protein
MFSPLVPGYGIHWQVYLEAHISKPASQKDAFTVFCFLFSLFFFYYRRGSFPLWVIPSAYTMFIYFLTRVDLCHA